ncbi:MAG: NAD-dependent epimerase/dehydratase family protein [Gaiella sp.]
MAERFLITGALGCIGAWTIRRLLDQGVHVVGFDLGSDPHRLRELLTPEELAGIELVRGDITDLPALERALDDHEVTNLVHLAALQVPFCRDDPPLGAAVNVVGTVNVFQAVSRRLDRIPRVVYASSAAVYGPDARGAEDELTRPQTHYGVYKRANEGNAAIFWTSSRVPSIGLRPFSVYGPVRDQGVTAAPTLAMEAAARREPYTIPYGGGVQLQLGRDVADALIASSRSATDGARVYNLPGHICSLGELIETIEHVVPEAKGLLAYAGEPLPFPDVIEADTFDREVGGVEWTPLEEGIRLTVEHARRAANTGAD